MRGDKRAALQAAQAARWITPACAGISFAQRLQDRPKRDHPRMRGDKVGLLAGKTTFQGSPPHARG